MSRYEQLQHLHSRGIEITRCHHTRRQPFTFQATHVNHVQESKKIHVANTCTLNLKHKKVLCKNISQGLIIKSSTSYSYKSTSSIKF